MSGFDGAKAMLKTGTQSNIRENDKYIELFSLSLRMTGLTFFVQASEGPKVGKCTHDVSCRDKLGLNVERRPTGFPYIHDVCSSEFPYSALDCWWSTCPHLLGYHRRAGLC